MSANTGISWTQATWNPVRGCERVSEGCRNCYAEIMAARHSYAGGWGEGLAKFVRRPDGTKEARWTGKIKTLSRLLDQPLRWRAPRRIFVNSMSDLFHEDVPMDFIAEVFAYMAVSHRHTFQVLTKRPARMRAILTLPTFRERVAEHLLRLDRPLDYNGIWPLKRVWIGVSVEDQAAADERIPLLLQTPAALRFVSAEPLLRPLSLAVYGHRMGAPTSAIRGVIDWLIIGGESGHARREMDIEDARYIIAQCDVAGVPVFVKQDSGPRPGMQGRFTDAEWARKEFPA